MNYNFKCKNNIIRVWCWDTSYHDYVTIYTNERGYDRAIREDGRGRFFTWNREKIYLKDWIRLSMKELKNKIDNLDWVTSDDLTQAILTDGVENVRFECPLNPISVTFDNIALCNASEHINVLCKISEKRYKVGKNYKITVIPVDENILVGAKDYYIGDMIGLIQSGHIKIII